MPPKGKQGTKGAKQIQEENESTLQFYFYVCVGVNVFFFTLTWLFFLESFTIWFMMLTVLTSGLYIGCYQFMKYMAKPNLDAAGTFLSPGSDLNISDGIAEHVKDLLLLTAIVQTLSLLSNYFWLFILLAPARAFYVLWVNFLGPWFFAPPPEVDEKKQKKMERKMKRR